MAKKNEYNASNINILEGLSAIRTRPGMYIGDVGERGLHHCVYEVVDNSIDEAVAGHGKRITLTKLKNGGIRVEDEGRGIPVDKKENGISAATITLTVLHAGGKFDKDTYKTSGGLHGIGIKATNAMSKWLKLTIYRDGEQWEQEFEKGEPLYEIKKVGSTKKRGTTLEFIPDDTLFDEVVYKNELLLNRLRTSSFLTKNVELVFVDEETKEKIVFYSEKGLEDMINYLIPKENILTPVMSYSGSDEKRGQVIDKISGQIEENGVLEKFDLEVSFLYEKGYKTTVNSFVNKILTPGGGVHEQGVMDALSSSILRKVKDAKVQSKKDKEILTKVNIEDIREGLVLAISISVYTELVFEGQTKEKLSGKYIRGMVRELSKSKIEQYLEENPMITSQIVQKVITARKARESAERARKVERKQQSDEIGSMLGKLSDCRSNNPEECELYICEGDSAAGSSKQGRNGETQAILPLKGKPINPLKNKESDVLKNEEILSLITALGCGVGDNINLENLRYHKIIEQTDADIDGCLRGDTKIKMLDNTIKTLKELYELYPVGGNSFNVWAYDTKLNRPVIGNAHSVRITKKVEKLYEITLNNDFKIFATSNHPFLDIYGKYIRADELKIGQQIESLYFSINTDGYECLRNKSVKSKTTHRYIAGLKENIQYLDVHHLDENKLNNEPKNLKVLTRKEHCIIHKDIASKNITKYNKSQKHLDDIKKGKENGSYSFNNFDKYNGSESHSLNASKRNIKMWKDKDYRKHMKLKQEEFLNNGGKELLSKNATLQWTNADIAFKMQATRMVNVIKECLEKYNKVNEEIYNKIKPKTGVPTWKNMLKKLNISEEEVIVYANTYNHKIKDIKIIEVVNEEVYDMTVDTYHNFGIIASEDNKELIFVHNSHIQQLLNTVFNTLFKPLLYGGYIYKAVPPLHRVKIGQESIYLNTDLDKKKFIETKKNELSKSIKLSKKYKEMSEDNDLEKEKKEKYLNEEIKKGMNKYVFNRFKGLGEMNPEQLSETTMEPKTRNIIQLKPNAFYDLSDEIDLDQYNFEDMAPEILRILKERKENREKKEKGEEIKNELPELDVDTIIALISSNEGTAFRKEFLLRNINLESEENN